ncbi:hypothetical protein BGP76_05350 [Reichenbachiella sp. MSK19-1]|nr:hypothetical protein BGP76_05350 [Reichenbachiella sp. MSK19-1]
MVLAQGNHTPKPHTDTEGRVYWNKSQPVYLRLASSPDDKGVLLKNDEQPQYTSPIYFDTEGINYIRTRHAIDNQTKTVAVPHQEVLLPVYADGLSPRTQLEIVTTNVYSNANIEYTGSGAVVFLHSSDAMSGVEQIYYSLNEDGFAPYTTEIELRESGLNHLRYYAVDHVGNVETLHEQSIMVDLNSPVSTHRIDGIQIQEAYSQGASLVLESMDSLSGIKAIYYQLDSGEYQLYSGRNLLLDFLTNGYHTLQYYAVDYVGNTEPVNTYEFYFDTAAPLMAADILGDRFIVGDQIYFSGRTKMKFTAVDNKAGIEHIKYSIDSQPFLDYDQPFYLPSAAGTHVIKYFAIDRFGNKTNDAKSARSFHEYEHQATKVYVDLTGPDLSYSFTGDLIETRDTVFVNSSTKVILQATDNESGMQKITYSLEGSAEEFDFIEGLNFVESGYHAVDFYGYDNVNNRNVNHMDMFVDNQGPKIFYYFSSKPYATSPEGEFYTNGTAIYLAAQDDHVGLKELYYRVDDGKERVYVGKVKFVQKNQKQILYIRAVDLLGNESEAEVLFVTGKN